MKPDIQFRTHKSRPLVSHLNKFRWAESFLRNWQLLKWSGNPLSETPNIYELQKTITDHYFEPD
jgi:hypothetical protein